METAVSKKFAILERFTKLKLYHSDELPFDTGSNDNDDDIDEIIIECGTLVKVYQTSHSTNKQNVTIQVLDFVNQLPIYENLYECPLTNLRYVNDSLWPYIINIENPARRLRVLQDEDHCKWLMYLKLNDFLSVCGEMFGRNNVRYDCIIRYIGPVSELYPVGYFFGLELLVRNNEYCLVVILLITNIFQFGWVKCIAALETISISLQPYSYGICFVYSILCYYSIWIVAILLNQKRYHSQHLI